MVMDPLAFLDSIAGHTQAQHPSRTVRLGVIDPAYTAGNPRVTFDGESTLSVKGYPYAGYTPVAGERVVLLPVANTYVIVGALSGTAATGSHNHDHGTLTGLGDNDHPQYSLSGHTHSTINDPDARYYQSFNQTVSNSVDTKMQFNVAAATDVYVEPSLTNNQNFTLWMSGLWRISAGMTWLRGTGGERHLSLQTGSTIDVSNWFARSSDASADAGLSSCYCSNDIRVSAGTVVCAIGWHSNGSSLTTDSFFGTSNHIAFTWIRS